MEFAKCVNLVRGKYKIWEKHLLKTILGNHVNRKSTKFYLLLVFTIFVIFALLLFFFVYILNSSYRDALMSTMCEKKAQERIFAFNKIEEMDSRIVRIARKLYEQEIDFGREASSTSAQEYLNTMNDVNSIYIGDPSGAVECFTRNGIVKLNSFNESPVLSAIEWEYTKGTLSEGIPIKTQYSFNSININLYSFVTYRNESPTQETSVIVNITEEIYISALQANLSRSSESDNFIISDKGVVLTPCRYFPRRSILFGGSMFNTILESQSSGYIREIINSVPVLISYKKSLVSGSVYINITPESEILQVISEISQIIYPVTIIAGFVLSIILLVSIFLIMVPVRKIFKNKEEMRYKLNSAVRFAKENYLYYLITTGYEATPVFDEQLKSLDIPIKRNEHLWILLLTLDNYTEFKENNSYDEQHALKFSIGNIATDICKDTFITEAVDTGASIVTLLMNIRYPYSIATRVELVRISRKIQEHVKKYLDLSVSISIAHNENGLSATAALYRNGVLASRYRLFYGKQCIIFESDVPQSEKNDTGFDVITQESYKRFAQLLSRGSSSDILNYIIEMGDKTEKVNVECYYNMITMVIKTIKNTLVPNEEQLALLSRIHLFQTRIEIENYLSRIIDELIISGERDHGDLPALVYKIIERDYSNPMFSVEQIADELAISASHLRNIYKDQAGEKLIDVITDTRIRHAKILLTDTDYSINQIAIMVGYPNGTYFYKVFKRRTGTTPNEFKRL